MNTDKNKRIGQKRRETNDRHRNMSCKVYELKIQQNKLSKSQKECLNMYFNEAKWVFNYILGLNKVGAVNIFDYNYKQHKNITKMDKNKQIVNYSLKYLPAQCYQELVRYIQVDIKSLAKRKSKGHKVGYLKFRTSYDSIDLRQYGVSYSIFPNQNKIKICGIKKKIKVNGLKQIPNNVEFANAKLVKKPNGLYLKVTTFSEKKKSNYKKEIGGIDFGIKTVITTSDGKKYDKITIEESESIKRLQRKILRNPNKNSNNRYKNRLKLQKAYQKLIDKKKDIANKIVSDLFKTYKTVCMQDELIKLWHSGFHSKTVQHSCLGLIKAKLKQSNRVQLVPSSFPSTKLCYICGNKLSIGLDERIYTCPICGLHEDRDIKAAKTILNYVLNKLGVGRTEITPVENSDPTSTYSIINSEQSDSMKQEAMKL